MGILHLEEAKALRKQGERLGRAGMSQYIIKAVEEFDGSYKGAIDLAGKLHAVAIASKADVYWREKMNRGYTKAFYEMQEFEPEEAEE